jgi:hypothetical protein
MCSQEQMQVTEHLKKMFKCSYTSLKIENSSTYSFGLDSVSPFPLISNLFQLERSGELLPKGGLHSWLHQPAG